MSGGWSLYVIALIVLNIVGCVWLLWWTARRRPGDPKPEDTSHVWDGDLTEYNKPLPRWWINLFYITIVFAIGYLVWYPGFGSFAGLRQAGPRRWKHDATPPRRRQAGRDLRPVQGPGDRRAGARPAGGEAGKLDLRQHLRHLPWLRGQGADRLSQPHR
jgi:hypothetical protein